PPLSRSLSLFFFTSRHPPSSTLFPYTTLFRSNDVPAPEQYRRWHSCQASPLRRRVSSWSTTTHQSASSRIACRRKAAWAVFQIRSEEHTSELQSRENLVCRLLLEKKNTTKNKN